MLQKIIVQQVLTCLALTFTTKTCFMKKIITIICLAAIFFGSTSFCSNYKPDATCTGAKDCNACKNCKYCKHCAKDGYTCGVCKK